MNNKEITTKDTKSTKKKMLFVVFVNSVVQKFFLRKNAMPFKELYSMFTVRWDVVFWNPFTRSAWKKN